MQPTRVMRLVCRSMPQYADGSFGAVLDKGTMDAMACGEKAAADIHRMLMESSRQVNIAQALSLLYSNYLDARACFKVPSLLTNSCYSVGHSIMSKLVYTAYVTQVFRALLAVCLKHLNRCIHHVKHGAGEGAVSDISTCVQ